MSKTPVFTGGYVFFVAVQNGTENGTENGTKRYKAVTVFQNAVPLCPKLAFLNLFR